MVTLTNRHPPARYSSSSSSLTILLGYVCTPLFFEFVLEEFDGFICG